MADRLERARERAWRYLNRRDRTVAEMRRHLEAKEVPAAAIDEVVAELLDGGFLDDERYAQRFAEDRRRLDGWGAERIERRLRELGVSAAVAAAAAAPASGEDERGAALAILRRRFPAPPRDDRERTRALGVLVRRGYESELAHDVVRAYTVEAAEDLAARRSW